MVNKENATGEWFSNATTVAVTSLRRQRKQLIRKTIYRVPNNHHKKALYATEFLKVHAFKPVLFLLWAEGVVK